MTKAQGKTCPAEAELSASDPRLIRDKEELRRLSQQLKARGKKVVTTNGCFDLLHAGHIYLLNEARKQGDIVIVGLNSDVSIRSYKGPGRPILPEDQRAAILLALEAVDYVCIYDEVECIPFVTAAAPDVHVNDASYGDNCIEASTVRACGGRLHLVSKRPGFSTTSILTRMRGE
ncbi:MAG: pantoate--beta-alanine ligase [Candidatus Sumerlaeota bacterium]|nr:pantoate--beta-alanine ligase [Candidatus Sumerlaeota bacterium]